jgi:hypothetical protein
MIGLQAIAFWCVFTFSYLASTLENNDEIR